MTTHRLFKILVVLFSLTAGGFLTWKLSRNLLDEASVGESGSGEKKEKEANREPYALPIGSKSAGGAFVVGEPDKTNRENHSARPLLSGSKSRSVELMPVDPAWEAAVPLNSVPDSTQPKSEEE